jgi:hypothetical protein
MMKMRVTTRQGMMFTRRLFCHKPFPENGQLAYMSRGCRIVYDPVRGRLWAVCEGCNRWNLCPMEERERALYELERIARDHAKLLAQTTNITLLHAGGLTLIRVGRPVSWSRSGGDTGAN